MKNDVNFECGDLVKMEITDGNFIVGLVEEICIGNFGDFVIYNSYKLRSKNGKLHDIDGYTLESIEKITREQFLDEDERKPTYPLEIFDNDDYKVLINENQTATLIKHPIEKEKLIDLTVLSKEEILNAYNKNKEFLYNYIINTSNINALDLNIDKLLFEASRMEDEQEDLYDEADKMIKEFRELNNIK